MSQFVFLNGMGEPTNNDASAFSAGLRAVFAACRARNTSPDVGVAIDRFAAEVDRRIDAFFKAPTRVDGSRIDVASSTAGLLGAGALRAVLGPPEQETRPLPTAFTLFSGDATSVPLGKNEVEASRVFFRGQVKTWGGGSNEIPTIGRAQVTRTWKVRYYITQIMSDIFEEMVEGAAGMASWDSLARAAIIIMEEYANQRTWYGDDVQGTYGVLNYPWFNRITLNGPSGKTWSTDEDLSSTVTEGYVKELVRFVTHAWVTSKGAFRPNRLIIGMKMMNFLKQTKVKYSTTTVGDRPQSVLESFLTSNAVITSEAQIAIAPELDDAFDATLGISCVVLDRKDPMVIANILPGGGPQMLPLITEGFNRYQPLFMAHGGIISRQSGVVTIGVVETTPA